jgi:hypothetical protein
MRIHKLTIFLLLLVFATLGLTLGQQNPVKKDDAAEAEYAKQLQARHLRFPTANYDEPDLTDPRKNEARQQKNRRKNNAGFVASNAPEYAFEVLQNIEGGIDLSSLPVAESSYIVLGKVTAAEAHLSQDKRNVYSEFKVSVEKVFKTATAMSEGAEIVVDRSGGFVKYPNGHSILYRTTHLDMPLKGERYLFFLTSKNEDLSILTAYELGAKGVQPLDQAPQFEKYSGVTESSLLEKLRNSLIKNSPY